MQERRGSRSQRVGLLALAMMLLAGGAAAVAFVDRGHSAPPIVGWTVDRSIPSTPLIDADGKQASLRALRGSIVVLAPFLTLCHETCPLTTGAFLQMRQAVTAAGLAGRVAFVEVTVDPARDSPARLRAYGRLTGANWERLTGTPTNIDRFWRFFGIGYRKVPEPPPAQLDWWTHKPERYSMEHTDSVFFIDARGRERIFIVGPTNGNKLPQALRALLSPAAQAALTRQTGTWTVAQALSDIGHLLGQRIPASGGS